MKEDGLSSSPPVLPSVTITPVIKNKPTNGILPTRLHPVKLEIEDEEQEEDSPDMSIFPVSGFQDQEYDAFPQDDSYNEDGLLAEDGEEEIGIKEAKIITIRVEGQRMGGKKMYKCSLCPNIKPWPTIHKAERHRITHIPLAFRKMFQCPQCKERFIKEKNVKRHIDSGLCQGPKEHPCTVCGEIYESKFDLQLHEENHEQLLKRHRCNLCGAKFNKMKYLNKHILSHSNRKPYKCDICGKSFKSEYYVKTHRNAHLNENYESSGTMENSNLEDFEFEEHLRPQIDLIEEDPPDPDSSLELEAE